jgi:Peptidase family M48
MKIKFMVVSSLILLLAIVSNTLAQTNCQPPKPIPPDPNKIIFTEEQEVFLGDAVADMIQHQYRIIEDDELTEYLLRISERLIKHLPPTQLRYRFFIIDSPVINAFALSGGRVYITRKLIAFTKNEDELAGVLAHELGHEIARHGAVEMSYLFKKILNVTVLTDKQDVYNKFNEYIEKRKLKPEVFAKVGKHEDKDQITADQIGVFAAAAAGYDTQAFVSFYDRLAETKGNKGNFFTDIFGATNPDSKRLRELTHNVESLPVGCKENRLNTTDAYSAWQSRVLYYTGLGRKESLHAVKAKALLAPGLRGDLHHLRFSPNGQYILAQDESGITVLTREPFALLFRINAEDVMKAHFTPDSQNIAFMNRDLRVQVWNIAEQSLQKAQEMLVRGRCTQAAVSPDGKTVACLREYENTLFLYDVASNKELYKREYSYFNDFSKSRSWTLRFIDEDDVSTTGPEVGSIKFSPDGHFLAVGHGGGFVVDTTTLKEVQMKGQARNLLNYSFAFVTPGRIVGVNREDVMKSGIISLPQGEVIQQKPIYRGGLEAPTRSPHLIVRPVQKMAVGLLDMEKSEIFKASKMPAIDIYDNFFIAERLTGEVGLYSFDKKEAIGAVILPPSTLGKLRAVALSEDFRYLALSGKTRGAVYDLGLAKQMYITPGFRGAHIANNALFADFPRHEEVERSLVRIELQQNVQAQPTEIKEKKTQQYGSVLVQPQFNKGKEEIVFYIGEGTYYENLTLDILDVTSQRKLWSKNFPNESPEYWINDQLGTMSLAWPIRYKAAKEEIKGDSILKKQLEKNSEKEGDYLVEVLDLRTGNVKGKILIETGKGAFRINSIVSVGDSVVIFDTENRALTYSLSDGQQKGKTFGKVASLSEISKLLCVENEPGRLKIYDLETMTERDQFSFSYPISMMRFSANGKALFVLTANQAVYLLDVSSFAKAAQ